MWRWIAGVAALGLLSLVGSRVLIEPTSDAWTLVAANGDGSLTWLRLSTTNTGLFADELTTRLVIVPPRGSGVEHRAVRGEGRLGDDGAAAGPDRVQREGAGWAFELGGEAVIGTGRVRGATTGCPPERGEAAGALEFEPDGLTIDGGAVVFRSQERGQAEWIALYVPDRSTQVLVDPTASCPAWWRDGEQAWAGTPGPWSIDGERASIELGPRVWTIRITRMGARIPALEGTLGIERAIARIAGYHPPPEMLQRVLVDPGDGRRLPGLLLRRDRAL